MTVIQNNLHAQGPEILEATVQNIGARNLYTTLFKKVLVSETNFYFNQFWRHLQDSDLQGVGRGGYGLDRAGSVQGQVAGTCE